MSRAEVMNTEDGNPIYDEDNLLAYDSTIAGLACNIIYIFAGDQLVRAKYLITEPHVNKTIYITDFSSLKEKLITKYGNPTKDDVYWRNDLYRNDPQSWGTAVSIGHLALFTRWETPETTIILSLFGDNFKVTFGIEYSSIALQHLEQQQKEQETQDAL